MFSFLTKRSFLLNLLVALALVFLVIFIILKLLGTITQHGQYLTVPSVTGKTTAAAISQLEAAGFEVLIQDSVYIDSAKKGIVLKQHPDPNSTVKINRTVFLTVNRTTLPLVDMPSLQGKTLSYALDILKRSHLVLGDTTSKPDFMEGTVLEQSYRGNVIPSGAKVPYGSKIDLLVGSGLADLRIPVPDLLGMTLADARALLDANGIELAAIIPDPGISDTLGAFVYKQNPPRFTENRQMVYIQSGQLMDIWISPVMKSPIDSTKNIPNE